MMKFKVLVGSMLAAGAMGGMSMANAGSVTGDMTVQTTLTSACEVSATSAVIDLGSVVALASTADKSASNTADFKVACTTGMTPVIYSTSTRAMADGASHSLPFALCLGSSCTGANALASTSTGDALPTAKDGSLHPVELTAKILATNFAALPAGNYTTAVTINVDY